MGIFGFLMSAFRFRTKLTTKERLQNIDDQLENLDTQLKRNRQLQKSSVFLLLSISVIIYFPSIIIYYLWYFPKLWVDRLLYTVPFLIFPVIVFFLKKLLHYIFVNKIINNVNACKELKKDKKKILETVMDTETYKVAKELLQKYDPHRSLVEQTDTPIKPSSSKHNVEEQSLRKRIVPIAPTPPTPGFRAPVPIMRDGQPRGPVPRVPVPRAPVPRTPVPIAPILPRDRSVFDKVTDYFVGDGPSNRFALICKQCYGHNGMVLAEEFEFTSYRCCYCTFFNAARKQRLNAPRLQTPISRSTPKVHSARNSETDGEMSSQGDLNEEKGDEKGDDKRKDENVFESEITENHKEKKINADVLESADVVADVKEGTLTENIVVDDTIDNSNDETIDTNDTGDTKKDR